MIIDHLLLNRGVIVEDIPIGQLDIADQTFSLGEDDASLIEESLRSDGQLEPIVVRRRADKWQIVDGSRRVAAATRLGWERISARLFDSLSDEEAARFAVRQVVTQLPSPDALEALGTRLGGKAEAIAQKAAERFGRRSDVSVEEEVAPSPPPREAAPVVAAPPPAPAAPPAGEEEVTIDELGARVIEQLSGISQDLALLQENWADLEPKQQQQLRELVRYTADLLPYLEEPQA